MSIAVSDKKMYILLDDMFQDHHQSILWIDKDK
jgi:hypothetical protein